MDIAAEAREFREAISTWAKGYAVERRLGLSPPAEGASAELDLQRWSRRYFSRFAEVLAEVPRAKVYGLPWAVVPAGAPLAFLALTT